MMGLLSLLAQRVPAALAEPMTELRELTMATSDYHDKVDQRLANFPQEIAAGVDVTAIAKAMSEAFRQQLASTGLENTASLLRNSCREITALSGQISSTLKPVSQEYKSMAATISADLAELTAASSELRHQNAQMRAEQQSDTWWWLGLVALVLLLLGGMAAMYLQEHQTAEVLSNMSRQLEGLRAPAVPAAVVTPPTKKAHGQKRKDDRG